MTCGCIPGVRPCAVAVALWERVADTHHAWAQKGARKGVVELWDAYLDAQDAYDAHLVTACVSEQPALLGEYAVSERYELYGPIRLADGRQAVYMGSGYHWGCCQNGEVLFADGHQELCNPADVRAISGAPLSLDADIYRSYGGIGGRLPLKGWARFADLKAAYDAWRALPDEERWARARELRRDLPMHADKPGPHYPWPYVSRMAAEL